MEYKSQSERGERLPMCGVCECGGGEASFHSLQGRFPPSLCMEILATALRKRRWYSTSKCTWTGVHLGSADPRWSLPGSAFLWLADMWALVMILGDSCLGAPIWFGLWALFVSVMQDSIFCVLLLRLLRVFFLFRTCIPKMA
jgi:hypothetical protein